jgi:hypothetical protein
MSSITQMKCACVPCLCVVTLSDAIKGYSRDTCKMGHDAKFC